MAAVIGWRKIHLRPLGRHREHGEPDGSYGLPGEIQVTDRVAAALGPGFAVRPRE